MTVRRCKHEIFAKILESADGGVKKTRLMYEANLSHTQLNKLLSELNRLELVNEEKVFRKNRTFIRIKTTERGLVYLKIYGLLRELLEDDLV